MASRLVLLNSGDRNPPIFIASGGGDDVRVFGKLVKNMESAHAIYGMQAQGIDDAEPPCERIEDVAQLHIEAVKQLQPEGPYFLIGYSFGGLVVLEMAQRLLMKEDKVGLLVMVEAYPFRRFLPPTLRFRRFVRYLKHHMSIMMQLPIRGALSHAMPYIIRRVRFLREVCTENDSTLEPHKPHHQCRSEVDYLAWTNYRPRRYAGIIKFVGGETSLEFPDAAAFWGGLADSIDIEITRGDHLGVIRMNADAVACVLSKYIAEAAPSN